MDRRKALGAALILLLISLFLYFPGSGQTAFKAGGMGPAEAFLAAPAQAKISPALQQAISREGKVEVLIHLAEQADVKSAAAKVLQSLPKTVKQDMRDREVRKAVVEVLRATARKTQEPLLSHLEGQKKKGNVGEIKSFYIVNIIYAEVSGEIIEALALRPDVKAIIPNHEIILAAEEIQATFNLEMQDAVEWNVAHIGAPSVWEEYGLDGRGVVVGVIDTGVDWTHSALKEKWRGYNPSNPAEPAPVYNWFDAVEGLSMPVDPSGHGTHVTGTILGSDSTNKIGVAPGAQWIGARVFKNNRSTAAVLLAAGEYMLAPTDAHGVPNPEMAPRVINCSWGAGGIGENDEWYREMVQNWRSAGILPVFAAGNFGPDFGTIVSPAFYPESFAVAALDGDDALAESSSRGPGPFGGVKPDIAAPGVNIRSSVPGGGYADGWQGTSMAAAHVSGTAALMLSTGKNLDAADIEEIMRLTAGPLVSSTFPESPNYGFGAGGVNAFRAVSFFMDSDLDSLYGSLRVALEPEGTRDAGAQWSVDGGLSWHSDKSKASLKTGEYQVTYKEVDGWRAPVMVYKVRVSNNRTTFIKAAYVDLSTDYYDSEFRTSIEKMTSLGVLEGREDGLFYPDDYLIRAEAAKVAALLLGYSREDAQGAITQDVFHDVHEGMKAHGWARGWINLIAGDGIILGDGTGNFNPGGVLKMDEWCTILLRILGYASGEMDEDWPESYNTMAIALGLDEGIEYGGKKDVSRAQMARFSETAVYGIRSADGRFIGEKVFGARLEVTGFYALGGSTTSSWTDLFGVPYPVTPAGNTDVVDELALGWYTISSAGVIHTDSGTGWARPENWEDVLKAADKYDMRTEMVVYQTNSGGEITRLLTSPGAVEKALEGIMVNLLPYHGVNLYLEGLDVQDRGNFTYFVSLLAVELQQAGRGLTLTMPPPDSSFAGYDYGSLGGLADRVIMMPRVDGVSPEPMHTVIQSIELARTLVAPEKLVLGIPVPGESWEGFEGKIKIAQLYGLRGVAIWRLGLVTPEMWAAAREAVR